MIKHIVMWKLKDEKREENALEIKRRLTALVGEIPELMSCEVETDIKLEDTAYDAVLIAAFQNAADLLTYKAHPAHVAVSTFVKSVRVDRKVVDFEY